MLKFPETLAHQNLNGLLVIMRDTANMIDDELDLDCSALRWVDPSGLCLFRHWIENLNDRDVRLCLLGLPLSAESFMRRMDVFRHATNLTFEDRTSGYARNALEHSLVEVRDVTDQQEADEAAFRIAATIIARIPLSHDPDPDGMSPSEADRVHNTVSYAFSEILGNALTHGRRRGYRHAHAKVAAQYFGRSKRLQIAILDDGCGLLESLRSHPCLEGDETDERAIHAALQPRVSCNRDLELGLDSSNQGIGLTVSTRLALETGGQFTIYSGQAAYNESALGSQVTWKTAGWQGTGVVLEFATERLSSVDVTSVVTTLPGYREEPMLNFE